MKIKIMDIFDIKFITDLNIWKVLEKIRKEQHLKSENEIFFSVSSDEVKEISKEEQNKILEKLEKTGVIRIAAKHIYNPNEITSTLNATIQSFRANMGICYDYNYFEILILEPKFTKVYKEYKDINKLFSKQKAYIRASGKTKEKNNTKKNDESLNINQKPTYLRSIHLVTKILEPIDVIFLVFDEHYHIPIRCDVLNNKGQPSYIKKLYDIAYLVNAPRKKVLYDKRLADDINNGLFKRRPVKKFLKTNKFKKPTLVQRSENKEILVLKNDVQIETKLIKNIPQQFQYLYEDKTM